MGRWNRMSTRSLIGFGPVEDDPSQIVSIMLY